ncbi:ABC transporter ATP-binding protein [Larkinella soli]|uniref:ABC transporter ATP-binding protein n=1 Tax=Larkinella soli TaxID=1770527 RepID=UPI000FFC3FB5|nr:ABC transporter ATP-binding protein [Larkinella soli]
MESKLKHNFVGYLQFFYRAMGFGLVFNIFLGFTASLLDGLSLAMFIPLLQYVSDGDAQKANQESIGSLRYVVDVLKFLNLELNVYTVLGMMVTLILFKGVINFWHLLSQVNLRRRYIKQLRYRLIDKLENLSYQGFLKLDAGRIQNNLTAEVSKLLTAITLFLSSTRGGVMLITYIFLAVVANWKFAMFVGVGVLLSNFLFKNVFDYVKRSSLDISVKGNVYYSLLGQAIHNYKYLKSTNHFPDFGKKIRNIINEIEGLNHRIGFNQALTAAIREPMVVIIVVFVIVFQLRWMGSSLGSILLSILLLYRSLGYLMGIQTTWQGFIQNVGSIDALDKIQIEMDSNRESQGKVVVQEIRKGVAVENVTFSYGKKKVLDNISLQIPTRSTVAFVGESGSGKTTLASLIMGLISPEQGTIRIDDESLSALNLSAYRSRIGYISQEPVIFRDDIYNNITFWAPRTPENVKRFWDVVEMASLTDYINTQPDGEHTQLGDNGMLISGGQKQRISIARELYKKSDILILDEATSALDSETERFIQENIEKLMGSYTIIIIAHRLSTIRNVDRIYLLDKGQISAIGTYEEMLEKSPRFRRMVSLQKI